MLLAAFLVASFLLTLVSAAAEVLIGNTTVRGVAYPQFDQEFFGGLPYAAPPVGALRLQPPVLQTTFNVSTFNATAYGPMCLQPSLTFPAISEDCLTLNILRPAGIPANASLPVMVWHFPGGFDIGGATSWNATLIVAQSIARGTPIIYVNLNYRLGPVGFPQGAEAERRGALNLGLKDQLAALDWIQANIGAFGGDKHKVTAFGLSAGAISLSIFFLNPGFGSLVRAGIFESGYPATVLTFEPSHGQPDWDNFVSAVSPCSDLAHSNDTFACIQAANSTEILQGVDYALSSSQLEMPFAPTLDGPGGVYPDYASNIWKSGQFAHLPFMAGCSLDEGTGFAPVSITSAQTIETWLTTNYTGGREGEAALQAAINEIMILYPDNPADGSPFGTGNQTFGLNPEYKRSAAIMDDLMFHAQRRHLSQIASDLGVPTWGWLFTDPQPEYAPYLGVTHGSELYYVYGQPLNQNNATLALSENIVDYWISFATSLDPNDGKGSARPIWPQYTPTNQTILQLNSVNLTAIPDTYRSEQIGFINSNPLLWHQ